MRVASLDDGRPDGRLLLVSRDLTRALEARAAGTLQAALDDWTALEPALREEARQLEDGGGEPLDQTRLLAVLPRSYQFLDGSAFLAHNHILADAWGYERRTPVDPPLMYQGLSDRFHPPTGDVSFPDIAHDIDFEAEFGIVTDRVPMGVDAHEALKHVKLLLMLNDWSLRAFGPGEMKAGFGFLQAKPPSTLSGIACTPDELGECWHEGRLAARLRVWRGEALFGEPAGTEMTYGFGELIAHAARTRELCPGTVIGSGTVSNSDAERVGSGCIAERVALDQIAGRRVTGYLGNGERIRLEAAGADGGSLFGIIDQIVRTL